MDNDDELKESVDSKKKEKSINDEITVENNNDNVENPQFLTVPIIDELPICETSMD